MLLKYLLLVWRDAAPVSRLTSSQLISVPFFFFGKAWCRLLIREAGRIGAECMKIFDRIRQKQLRLSEDYTGQSTMMTGTSWRHL